MKIAQECGITLGRHLQNPRGIFDPIEDISELATRLRQHHGPGAWWAPGIFAGDYRNQENWLGTWFVAIDGDYYAKGAGHSAPPDEKRVLVASALMDGTGFHGTPRGFRNILPLDRFVSSAEEYEKLAHGVKVLIERGLERVGVLGLVAWGRDADGKKARIVERDGFIVDTGALFDRARLFFTPNATVEGEASPRRADIHVIGGAR